MIQAFLRKTGLKQQITFVVSIAILALAVAISLQSSWESKERMRDSLVEHVKSVTATLTDRGALALIYNSPENVNLPVNAAIAMDDVVQIDIFHADGELLLSRKREHFDAAPFIPLSQEQLKAGRLKETADYISVAVPVLDTGSAENPFQVSEQHSFLYGYVHVVVSKDKLNRVATDLLTKNLLVALIIAAGLIACLRVLTGAIAKPVDMLSHLMSRAGKGELGIRADVDGPHDVAKMATSFNSMMEELEVRENALKASRDEAVQNAMINAQFSATISHEVRTPLTGVISLLGLLRKENLTKQQREYVDSAYKSSTALINLLSDTFDISRMNAGDLKLNETDFDLHKLVEDVIDVFGRRAHAKGIYVGYVPCPFVADRMKGDAMRLRQVLTNLLSNAIKFTDTGEIAIKVTGVDEGDVPKLRFEITDTGIGLTPDEKSTIFESPAQLALDKDGGRSNSGLGIAISKQIVKLMGGDIGVESEKGKGSTFWFTITCKPSEAVELDDDHPLLFDTRVLIADESSIVREFVAQCLSKKGMRCEPFDNGDDAWAALVRAESSSDPFRLVIAGSSLKDGLSRNFIELANKELIAAPERVLALDLYGAQYRVDEFETGNCLGRPLTQSRLINYIENLLERLPDFALPSGSGSYGKTGAVDKSYRVLVAEPDADGRGPTTAALAAAHCECILVGNGAEALQALEDDEFDFILMAVDMPVMDGCEAALRIRENEARSGAHTPIVALINEWERDADRRYLAFGMDDSVHKPLTADIAKALVQRVLRQPSHSVGSQPFLFPELELVPSTPATFDLGKYEELKSSLGDALGATYRAFLEDIPDCLNALDSATASGNVTEVTRLLHLVKGTSANLGAVALSSVAKDFEQRWKASESIDSNEMNTKLRAAFDLVEVVINRIVPDCAPSRPPLVDAVGHVMIADDDRVSRIALRGILERQGYRVTEAENGAEILSQLENQTPDVILMDAVMPVLDGFEACSRIQSFHPSRACPVIMMTALEDEAAVEKAFAAGASDYVTKSSGTPVLLSRIKHTVETSEALRAARARSSADALTGLLSRTAFYELVAEEISASANGAAAVLYLDIDRFSSINHEYGYDVGDQLLVEVALRLKRTIGNRNCVARFSGSDFAIFISDMSDNARAKSAADLISTAIAQPFVLNHHQIFAPVSIGIATYPADANNADALVKCASTAMAKAKKANTSIQFYQNSMEPGFTEKQKVQEELRGALDNGELTVLYQPVIAIHSGLVEGMEALVRWNHPVRGMLLPADFIPTAVETGLIIQLGEWVMRRAFAQLKKWHSRGWTTLKLSLNVSSEELLHPDFANQVRELAAESAVAPSAIILDIAEITLVEHIERIGSVLGELRNCGVSIAVDDFGTGFIPMSYLQRLPIGSIKIDRAFIRDVPHTREDSKILESMLRQARDCGFAVVAEGVERRDQYLFLREYGCSFVQGNFTGSVADPAGSEALLTLHAHNAVIPASPPPVVAIP
jgi:diguanylate cyclase (GGDEF)-like protein